MEEITATEIVRRTTLFYMQWYDRQEIEALRCRSRMAIQFPEYFAVDNREMVRQLETVNELCDELAAESRV